MLKKQTLIAALTTAFALPGMVLAADPPKPAIPTLDQVLDASGVSLNGYIDAGYEYSNKIPSDRVFDTNRNSFDLHQLGLTVAKQPKDRRVKDADIKGELAAATPLKKFLKILTSARLVHFGENVEPADLDLAPFHLLGYALVSLQGLGEFAS